MLALLQNGNVLTAGGYDSFLQPHGNSGGQATIASAEIFNVTTHTWHSVGSMATARSSHQVLNKSTSTLY